MLDSIAHIELHDSILEKVRYADDEKELILEIGLSGHMQPDFDENSPEYPYGNLIFSQVRNVEVSDPYSFGDLHNLEITSIKPLQEEISGLQIVMYADDHLNTNYPIVLLNIYAESVEWIAQGAT